MAGDEDLNDYGEYVACPPPLECVLNVAGSRESQAPGIQDAVFRLMVDVLMNVNITSEHFIRLGKAKRVGSCFDTSDNSNLRYFGLGAGYF